MSACLKMVAVVVFNNETAHRIGSNNTIAFGFGCLVRLCVKYRNSTLSFGLGNCAAPRPWKNHEF